MSTRGRAIAVIISTLLLGVVIGTLIVGPFIARQHFKHLDRMRTPGGFAARLEEIIDPDPEQAEAVREILTRYSHDIHGVTDRHHSEIRAMIDSLRAELDPILTEDQKQRLERHKPGRKPRWPPGQGRS